MDIPHITFDSGKKGKHLLVFGAIHGNETCGTVAIQKVINELETGLLQLTSGKVTFVPVCNVKAYEAGVRYIDEDLNRTLIPYSHPTTNEQKTANILCPLIEHCDVLLDIHSMGAKSVPCAFEDYHTPQNRALIKQLGIQDVFVDWANMYGEGSGNDTLKYAHKNGKIAVTVECGQHLDPEAPNVAYKAILNTLIHLEMLEKDYQGVVEPYFIQITHMYRKPKNGTFIKKWKHLDKVKKGETIATQEKEKYTSPMDGFIIMPSTTAKTGTEWYFLGQEVT